MIAPEFRCVFFPRSNREGTSAFRSRTYHTSDPQDRSEWPHRGHFICRSQSSRGGPRGHECIGGGEAGGGGFR
jgi:hypothetical protein